ncbi:MAG: 2-C-methyl-D-erythritol 4-phosphate cytidylyltransferase [Gammaproteobacteria bacterium]|nr:2-C-methyl-D-erythritol 4-phosphate cytidylyltransferase [Gammaproteobacteria bacterium]
MSEAAYWAVIPAAGVGRRMGSAVPKQYLQLAGRAVIDHSIERILLHPRVDGVCVAISDADAWWQDTEFAGHPDLVTVSGGAERCHSVLNALEALRARASDDDWVLVHDAARPCVRRADIDRLIDAAIDSDAGAVLGMPVRDTMKRCDADERVVETVDRNHLWHAFTPQMFRFGSLYTVLGRALAAGVLVTDEASAIEWEGQRPVMVEGHADNIKITRAEDLGLAAHYLAQQELFGQPG